MADIFISYSKSRRTETVTLAAALERRGFSVWWDKDITPGEAFRDTIAAELANARAAIVIWTPASVKSNWVISEATRAQKRGILIALHSSDLNIDHIPQPFDVVHTEPVENLTSVFAALARMDVTPSARAPTPAVDVPQDDKGGGSRATLGPSRRAMLFGGGAISMGAVATAVLYMPKDKDEPSRPPRKLAGHDLYVSSVAYATDGRRVISGSWDQTLRLWDPTSEREPRRFEGHQGVVWSVAVLPDGNRALSAGADRTLKLWDLANSRPVRDLNGHEDEVWSVAILPDGNRALSGSKDSTLKLWDLSNAKVLRTFRTEAKVPSAALAPGGQVGVAAAGERLQAWNLSDGARIRLFEGHEGKVNGVAVTRDGRHVLSASSDTTLRLWDLSSGREIRKLRGHKGEVFAVAVSPNGRTAVTGSRDKTLMVWDLTGTAATLA